MRIVILGGTRFIGPPTVKQLVEAGHDVTVFHRGETEGDLPPQMSHVHGDRARLSDFRDEFRRLAPDVVVDMRALVERDARTVMDVFRGIASRVVVLSSMDVYRAYGILRGIDQGPLQPVPFDEDAELRRTWYPYRGDIPRGEGDPQRWMDEYDKIPVERTFMSDTQMPGTVLRLPAVYGPGDSQHRLFDVAKRINDGRSVMVIEEAVGRWRFTHAYVENVAAAIVLAATDQRAIGRIYNVGEMDTPPRAVWTERVAASVGWNAQVVVVPSERLPAHLITTGVNLNQDLVGDSTRIRTELGYTEAVSWDEGVRQTIAWERRNPPPEIDPNQFDYDAEDAALSDLRALG